MGLELDAVGASGLKAENPPLGQARRRRARPVVQHADHAGAEGHVRILQPKPRSVIRLGASADQQQTYPGESPQRGLCVKLSQH
jgi:hypothetical protein